MDQDKIKETASVLAEKAATAILQSKDDPGSVQRILVDLKREVIEAAAALAGADFYRNITEPEVLVWEISKNEPDFTISSNATARLSIISLAAAVFLGWLAGGLISGILGFFSLGGDILRALTIFAFIWLEDYLASTPDARHKFLKYAGWLSLAGLAARLGAGLARFGSGLRGLIFGGVKPGFFKGVWLIIGAFFIFIFFSKRKAQPDLSAVKSLLLTQIEQRLSLFYLVFEKLSALGQSLRSLQQTETQNEAYCPRKECVLAQALYAIMPTLSPEQQKFAQDRLRIAGYAPESGEAFGKTIFWNQQEHGKLYRTLGFVKDGDKCIVLKQPVIKDKEIIKGLVQTLNA